MPASPTISEFNLVAHHVGGRGGTRAFPITDQLRPGIVTVLYDADDSCLEDMRSRSDDNMMVVASCVGGHAGQAAFHINYDPYTSSMLPLDKQYASFSFFHGDHDYQLGDVLRPVRTINLQVETLTDICRRIPAPDFLSLDTQGAELDILSGAQPLMENILAVNCEVEFRPIYANQSLFSDIDAHMRQRGFVFAGFSGCSEFASSRRPLGQRGRGFLLGGDALFLRRPETVGGDPHRKWLQLNKLAFCALVFGHLEYALDCLDHAGPCLPNWLPTAGEPAYLRLMLDFYRICTTMPATYPPLFSELFSFDQAVSRTESETSRLSKLAEPGQILTPRQRLKLTLSRWPWLLRSLQKMHTLALSTRQSLAVGTRLARCYLQTSELERLLMRFGLNEVTQIVRRQRIHQSAHAHKLVAVPDQRLTTE